MLRLGKGLGNRALGIGAIVEMVKKSPHLSVTLAMVRNEANTL